MFKKIGSRIVAFNAENEGGGGGATAQDPATATAPAAPWAADAVWTLGEGEAARPWYAAIPEEAARQHVEAKGYKNPAELALANYSLTKMQREGVVVPGDNATPEETAAFYNKLGRPEAADGYDFKFGDGVTADEGMMTWAKTAFHEVGLSSKQAQALAEKWNAFAPTLGAAGTEAIQQQNTQELNDLTARWGADLDKNRVAGQRAMQALGLSADLVTRVENSIGSAAVVEMLAAIGRKSDEGGFMNGGGGGNPNDPSGMTRDQAQARIAALNSDKAFQERYLDKTNAGHAAAVDEMQRLYMRL